MSTATKPSAKQVTNAQEALDAIYASISEGLTRVQAMKLMSKLGVKNTITGWNPAKPKDEQSLRVSYHASMASMRLWWGLAIKKHPLSFQGLYNIALLIDEQIEAKPDGVPAPPAPKPKARAKKKAAKKPAAPKLSAAAQALLDKMKEGS